VSLRDAIDRLRIGKIGICVYCGRRIPLHELETRPTTQVCPRCRPGSRARKARPQPRMRDG
jgi:RNA polymerase-binding transcription factor DksA